MQILKEYENYCGKSVKKYENNQVMPIMSLFATTKSFLNNQTKVGNLVSDFNLIHTYDLNALTTTNEDKIIFSNTNETTITTSLTNSKNEIKKSKSLINLTKDNKDSELETNNELSATIEQKKSTLAELNEKLTNINKEISDFKVNFQKEKQILRKWWHWPLKFITCGMWESKEIKQLNEKYSVDKYNELNWKFTELKDEIKTLETEIESLKTTCSLTNGTKSQSFNDLNEDNINSLFTKNFKSSEVNDFDETSLSNQISSSISPSTL